ncbi:VOC family protein [Paractinoplanes rishiriensis]|uniref:VOC domain-containing protein n=1 Tax=Paractinoplanes rishiriensis TaxID=1050105 RepID=A0A919K2B5_9ACTN|nr:VOC family protein [Actinoplanes rishiriensis]GIE97534.1 hypothetical protein Ari01nite_49990 [Actinoplanes rishiriensis]
MTTLSASASVDVAVDPPTAFRAFTEEIDRWWVPGPINAWNFARAVTRRIEPGVGGRVLEVYDDDGDGLELGRITVWEPGSRLAYRSSVDDTEVDIRFEPVDGGTRVSVEHFVRPGGNPEHGGLFWPNVIRWLEPWCRDHDPSRPARRLARLAVALYYQDPAAAARWLAATFDLRSWDRIPAEGESAGWIELHAGEVSVLLFAADGKWSPEPVSHNLWVYVDDLDAHLEHARAAGATIVTPIQEHGYRAYTADDLEGHRWTFVQTSPAVRG